jgi:hypothetical protein
VEFPKRGSDEPDAHGTAASRCFFATSSCPTQAVPATALTGLSPATRREGAKLTKALLAGIGTRALTQEARLVGGPPDLVPLVS